MKKRTVKLFAALTALLLMVGLLGGCTGGTTSTPEASAPESSAPSSSAPSSSAPSSSAPPSSAPVATINALNVTSFAYSNGDICGKPVKGVVLDFHGLNGGMDMTTAHSDFARRCAGQSVLYISPYDNPWSWMNDRAVRYVDELVDAFFVRFQIAEDTPIVTAGGSMGGLSSLVYTHYAKRTPVACAALSPVTDLAYHYTERTDLPRTIYQAFMHYDSDLDTAMKTASPYHLAADMPQIPYLIAHGDADYQVNKAKHSDAFVAELRKNHSDVTYLEMPGAGHCELTGSNAEQYYAFILSHAS